MWGKVDFLPSASGLVDSTLPNKKSKFSKKNWRQNFLVGIPKIEVHTSTKVPKFMRKKSKMKIITKQGCTALKQPTVGFFLSIPISISIIFKRAYQYQYFINYSKNSLINFNINISYQYLLMILLRLPISYQLVIVININVDINYQNRLLSISMRYQLSEHSLINFNININIAIFAYQYFLINALSSSDVKYHTT